MALEAAEIPKLILLFIALGISGYVTVWLAGQIRTEIKATVLA